MQKARQCSNVVILIQSNCLVFPNLVKPNKAGWYGSIQIFVRERYFLSVTKGNYKNGVLGTKIRFAKEVSVLWVCSECSLSVLWVCSEWVALSCPELRWSCCSDLHRALWQCGMDEWKSHKITAVSAMQEMQILHDNNSTPWLFKSSSRSF